MNEEKLEVIKEKLGVDEWLELIREDKFLYGAYISVCQYIDLTEQENKKLKRENDILLNVQEDCEKSLHKIRELKKELNKVNEENKKLKEQIEVYEDPEDLTLIFMYCDIEAKDKIKELKKQLEEYKKIVKGTERVKK